MTNLPSEFTHSTRLLMGDERFERFLHSFEEPSPVSIRLNPLKSNGLKAIDGEQVPWCQGGYYLKSRPNFTFDPLFHAGCYYVQEASSMFLDEVLRQHLPAILRETGGGTALDLCAAPGGKSTLLRAALPADWTLYSNEPMRNRASILLENVTKWGHDRHHVTNLFPKDYRKSKMKFDLILCDVPCSGEGMFRKDEATIGEWSPQNVERCWQLQRDIVSDAWQCLNEGGLLIYGTCTFNTKENEENIQWIIDELDAEVLPVATKTEWNITGSLLEEFTHPVYRFIPGITRGEGLFMCVLRKRGDIASSASKKKGNADALKVLTPPVSPLPAEADRVELTYQQAIAYLRGEALVLPADTPRGIVAVAFQQQVLGAMKNIGSRANNLYPKEWRIRTTHTPDTHSPILG